MAAYSEDLDLISIRPDILNLGVEEWSEKHDAAKIIIDRAIDRKWYRSIALDNNVDYRDVPFDSDYLGNSGEQLKTLSCYKTLELIYLNLQKNTPEDDGFERQRKLFKGLYEDEFSDVVDSGLDYDWNRSGDIVLDEQLQTKKRRVRRA